MANLIGQCTIPAGGKVQLSTGIQQPSTGTGAGVGAPPVGNLYVQQLVIQNNSGATLRIGDVTVSATRGLLLPSAAAPPNSANLGAFINYGTYLSDWWCFGTAGDVVDFLYIQ
jgi:hypothetical protein